MKIMCGDESGSRPNSDAMVVCGLMVDARVFFKTADEFSNKIAISRKLEGISKSSFKTSEFIGGVNATRHRKTFEKRKNLVKSMCDSIVKNNMEIFCIGISFDNVKNQLEKENYSHENNITRTLGGMFICKLIQDRVRNPSNELERTFVVFDNHGANSHVNRMLDSGRDWTDGIRQVLETRTDKDSSDATGNIVQYDQIIDRTVYGIQSKLSPHVQMADMVSYIYRRKLNLVNSRELWRGEKAFVRSLVNVLEPQRCKIEDLSSEVDAEFTEFYERIKHPEWNGCAGR